MLEEIKELTSYVASAKGANALFGGNHNFNAYGKPVAIQPKGFTCKAFCCISNCCRTCARPKSEHELVFFS